MFARQDRDKLTGEKPVSSLDFDLDLHMNNLGQEWRQAYESSIVARARERLERSEALKARIMAKIERLEDAILGQD
jgi:hypothetical protein